jgi:DNA invertase Pin-like site-specific DNA recombinase
MALIGYARVSTAEQDLAAQRQALAAAGCAEIVEETASGGDASRPELARLLGRIGRGDTLVVARLDRLARSLAHLLAVIAGLAARGARFRSLADPIDTTGPSGTLVLQILGAVAEFERALIRERTRAGLAAARARGRRGGNPGLRARDPATIVRLARAREEARLARALPTAEAWIGPVRRLRPVSPWPEVARAVNEGLGAGTARFSPARLKRLARLFARAGLLEPGVLGIGSGVGREVGRDFGRGWERGIGAHRGAASPHGEVAGQPAERGGEGTARPGARWTAKRGRAGSNAVRTVELAAAYLRGRPDATLAELGAALLRLGAHPPRGGTSWAPSSLKRLLDRGRALGLITTRRDGPSRLAASRQPSEPGAAG